VSSLRIVPISDNPFTFKAFLGVAGDMPIVKGGSKWCLNPTSTNQFSTLIRDCDTRGSGEDCPLLFSSPSGTLEQGQKERFIQQVRANRRPNRSLRRFRAYFTNNLIALAG